MDIVQKHLGHDPTTVLFEYDNCNDMPHDAWVAFHTLMVLRDPLYLMFMTNKLQTFVNTQPVRWDSAMSAVTAADIHRDCDIACAESVVKHLSKLTVRQLEIVGI